MKAFRETLWFKTGQLDADREAAESEDAPAVADTLPIEDRYVDNDQVTRQDSIEFGVRTGTTGYLERIPESASEPAREDGLGTLVREMKRGRRGAIALLGGSVVMVSAMLLLHVM